MKKNKLITTTILSLFCTLPYAQSNSDYEIAVKETIKRNQQIEAQYKKEVDEAVRANKNSMTDYRRVYDEEVRKAILQQKADDSIFKDEVNENIYKNRKALEESNRNILLNTTAEIQSEEKSLEFKNQNITPSVQQNNPEITLEVGKDSDVNLISGTVNMRSYEVDNIRNSENLNN